MSWFGRTVRNRRRERRLVPEVTLHSRTQAGPLRRAAGRLILTLVLLAAAVTGTTALVVTARDHWLHRIEALALRHIRVTTDGILRKEEILQVSGVRAGQNLLAIDLPAVQASLLRHPRVAAAELRRELPDQLRLDVRERFPVVRVPMPSGIAGHPAYLLDESGFVMFPSGPGQVPPDVIEFESSLPVLLGAPLQEMSVGTVVADPPVQAALRLLATHAASPLSGAVDILSVDISRPGDLVVLTSQGGQVTFAHRGDDPRFQMAFQRWIAVLEEGRRRQSLVWTLDLSVTNNVPVRFREQPGTPEPETPRPARPRRRPAPRNV